MFASRGFAPLGTNAALDVYICGTEWPFLRPLSLIKLSKCDEDYNELKKERPIVVIGKT